jgi:TPR repeat protein
MTDEKPRTGGFKIKAHRLAALMRFATPARQAAAAASATEAQSPSSTQKGLDIEQHLQQLAQMAAQSHKFQQLLQQQLQQQSQQFNQMQQQFAALAHHFNLKMDDGLPAGTQNDLSEPSSTPNAIIVNSADAKAWYTAKEFQPLLDWSQQATTDGDADGAYYLGLLLSEGRVIVPAPGKLSAGQPIAPLTLKRGKPGSPDHYRAFRLWTIAANQGHLDAQHALGWLHFNGNLQSTPKDATDAMEWTGPGGNLVPFYYSGEWGPDRPTAVKWFTSAAEGGHIDSQYALGKLYTNDKLASRDDYKTAVKWYTPAALTQAAEQGDKEAQRALGDLYLSDKLGPIDYPTASRWYTKAAEQGCADSQYALGQLHSLGHLGTPDYNAAFAWYTKAANKNHIDAHCALARLQADCKLGTQRTQTVFKWYTKAAEQGHLEFQAALGDLYSSGTIGDTPDYDAAAKWYAKAGAQGHLESQIALANIYLDGKLGYSNYTGALDWFSKAGEQGDVDSQIQAMKVYFDHRRASMCPSLGHRTWPELTKMAEEGDILSQRTLGRLYHQSNEADAKKWYAMASEQGDLESTLEAWDIAEFGHERDLWRSKAAEQGHAESQYEVGCYCLGSDTTRGVSLLTKAAEQGHLFAQSKLGSYYLGDFQGRVPIDAEAGVFWLTKAAEAGEILSVSCLAKYYSDPPGRTAVDGPAAVYWLTKAEGFRDSKVTLGDMYYEGRGVAKDLKTAFEWYSRAAEQGFCKHVSARLASKEFGPYRRR